MTDHPSLSRIRRFLAEHAPPTPCLVIDTDQVIARARWLGEVLPEASLSYAVKANPEPAVVTALAAIGAGFDVASTPEIELCLACGARPESISYGNTIKKQADIAFAYARGVRHFITDTESDLHNLIQHAPGASVTVRLLTSAPESMAPFGRKFGCQPDTAIELMTHAAEHGLDPAGVCFHVGSQQLDTSAWDAATATASRVFAGLAQRRITPRQLNVGGGFGVAYTQPAPSTADYAAAVRHAMRRYFPGARPELVLEPGRLLVADAGVIRTEIVLISQDSASPRRRWIYLDIGRYNGLAETENEAIAYSFVPVSDHNDQTGPVIIAGPTCDGDDVLYQQTTYELPLSLRGGDQLDILSTGAYTASYSSVAFNGIEPLRTYCLVNGRLADEA